MWRFTGLIFSILVPSLLARTVNFDPNVADRDLDNIIIRKHVPERCDTEESVKLSYLRLTEVPKHAVRSKAIRSLALENNFISNVPADIFEDVPNLQCLNLAQNRIPFKQLLNIRHESLKVLNVDHQDYRHIWGVEKDSNSNMLNTSETFLPNLESLHLNGVNFEFFDPNFNQSFPRLTTLYMTENELAHVDSYILSKLPRSLRNLHLEKNNIEVINLEYVENLSELYLDENPLRLIEIYDSNNSLRRLSLSKCFLEHRLVDVLQTHFPFLTELDISSNKIPSIPVYTLKNTPSLEVLSLSHNKLTTLPDLQYLTKLRRLSLSHNSIEDVADPILPSSLKILSLRGNRIRSIDTALFELHQLEELDLSENMLQSLSQRWARNIKKLKYLNLKSNQFASIEDMMVSSLLALDELHIKDNVLKKIDQSSLQLVPSQCTVYVI